MALIVKILGCIDLTAALAFLMLTFGIVPYAQYTLFCAGLLFVKSLFILGGDVLSAIDLGAAVVLIVSLFLTPPTLLLWVPALLLCSKGLVSFL